MDRILTFCITLKLSTDDVIFVPIGQKLKQFYLKSNVRPRLYLGMHWRDFSENSYLSRDQASGHAVRNFILYYVMMAFIVVLCILLPKARDFLKDLAVGGRIILKLIIKKWDEK